MRGSPDIITLRFPRETEYLPVLRLILGGIGVRKNLSLDAVDDIQLAVDNLIAEDRNSIDDLSMTVVLEEQALRISLGRLRSADLYNTLRRGEVPESAQDHCLDVCLLLRSLVNSYEVKDLSQGMFAVEMLRRTE